MAITNAQQYKQLVNPPMNGKRPGYRGDAAYGDRSDKDAIGDGPKTNAPSQDRIQEIKQANEVLNRLADDKAQVPYETLIIKDSNLPGLGGIMMNALKGPRQSLLNTNVDYFRGLKSRGALDDPRYTANAQGYKNYMSDRLSGMIDASGNSIDQDDDNNNIIIPDSTMNQGSSITEQEEDEGLRLAFRANGGMAEEDDPVGGIMDLESGRQMYFLGKLVKKATRAVKKIAKSPIGKAALLYAGTAGLGALGAGAARAGTGFGIFSPSNVLSNVGTSFLRFKGSPIGEKIFGTAVGDTDIKRTGGLLNLIKNNPFSAITGASLIAGALTSEQEDQAQQLADNTGIDIEAARNSILQAGKENYSMDVRARGFKADGGLMRLGYQEGGDAEPVAKKTMPLLDMDGKEKDYRETGGFVDMGRMERADDVPARLSKNEFVFTADAVRNAGEGDIDKGAEVMYNMMKNLEAGGEVSEESQGLNGARKMFQTSQRLEEVL